MSNSFQLTDLIFSKYQWTIRKALMTPNKKLALGVLATVIVTSLLGWIILTNAVQLTVFDGQWASITWEGKEFKFIYDASSGTITRTGDLVGSDSFRADTDVSSWWSWEDEAHVLFCKVASVNPSFVVLRFTNGAGEMLIGTAPSTYERIEIGTISLNDTDENSLLAPVKYVLSYQEKPIILTHAILKDETGEIVFQTQLLIELPPYTERTVNISTGNSLPSGTYTVTVTTSAGGAFLSPSFSIP